MNITIKDIAKIANVSYATVSRALNGHKDVNEKTRKRIIGICEQIGYSPNAIARGLVTKNSNTIGLLLPDITNPFFPEVAWGVEDEVSKRGYNVFLCNTSWDLSREETYLKLLLEKRVEGIIIAPVSDESKKLIDKYVDKLPVVLVGSSMEGGPYNFVVADNVKDAFLATEYLISLGHKKIAFIGGNEHTCTYRERLKGYKSALEEYGLGIDESLIRSGAFKRSSGYEITKIIIKENSVPTAIVAANDIVALGVIEAAEEFNLSIPDNMSLIGFDDIPYASLPKIRLTTISQPKYDIGKIAVDILFKKVDSKRQRKTLKEIVQTELKIRSTCKQI